MVFATSRNALNQSRRPAMVSRASPRSLPPTSTNEDHAQLFVAAYLSPLKRRPPARPSKFVASFYDACDAESFPYDIGDDPSFFASRQLGGPVTWGICRPDVRGMIHQRDWVSFFSARRLFDLSAVHYHFVAALQVEKLLSHASLFKTTSVLSSYLNLVMRPSGTGWEHHEPGLHPRDWHDDWMWRICRRSGLRKKDVVEASRAHQDGAPLRMGATPLPLADNYIVFGQESAIRPTRPILVAEFRQGDLTERWIENPTAIKIRALVFGESPRALRITNPQQPHRHFRRTLHSSDSWRHEMRQIVDSESDV